MRSTAIDIALTVIPFLMTNFGMASPYYHCGCDFRTAPADRSIECEHLLL